jgi:hypothetical protein
MHCMFAKKFIPIAFGIKAIPKFSDEFLCVVTKAPFHYCSLAVADVVVVLLKTHNGGAGIFSNDHLPQAEIHSLFSFKTYQSQIKLRASL